VVLATAQSCSDYNYQGDLIFWDPVGTQEHTGSGNHSFLLLSHIVMHLQQHGKSDLCHRMQRLRIDLEYRHRKTDYS
jgi:hypothetical protein